MWTFTDTIMQDAPYVITAVVIIALLRYVYVNRHDFRFQHWKNIIFTVYLMAVLRVCTYVPIVKKEYSQDKYMWIFDRYSGSIVYGKVILSLIIVSALAGVLLLVGKMLSKRSNNQS